MKYFFFSILEHQFQALVRRPSMHEPPSSPSPSKACLKKSHRISSFAACNEPYSLAMYLRRRGRQRGSRQAVHILHLATEARAKATARREEKKRTRIRKIRQKQASRAAAAAAAARPACLPVCMHAHELTAACWGSPRQHPSHRYTARSAQGCAPPACTCR